jgi:PAS domain S-box-containing protein
MRRKTIRFEKRIFFLMAGMIFLLGGEVYAFAKADTLTLQLKWWHQFQFAGYYAADYKGFFKEEGLLVNIKPGGPEIAPVQEVLEGRADIGVTGCEIINEFVKGKQVQVIGVIFQRNPYVIISLQGSGIYTPHDLVGKKIMASGDQGLMQVRSLFLKEGIDPGLIKTLEHSWNNQDLIDGKIDAITGYYSVEPNQIRKQGKEPVMIKPDDYGVDFYGDLLFAKSETIEQRRDEVVAFKRAMAKGWEYALNNPEELANYILQLPGVQERDISINDLLVEAQFTRELVIPELVQVGHMNPARWEYILSFYVNLGLIKNTASLDGFLFSEVLDDEFKTYFEVLSIIMSGLVVLFLAFLINNRILRKRFKESVQHLLNEQKSRIETEHLLKSSEERLQLAVDAAELGVWEWDLVSDTSYMSDTWKKMLGYAPNALADNSQVWESLIHPDDKERIIFKLNEHIAGIAEYNDYEYRLKTKAGDYKWVLNLSKAVERDSEGKAIRIIGIHLDISQTKQKEVELRTLTNELMKSNAELEKFAYITSHNLRAPVVNLVSLIKYYKDENLNEEERLQMREMLEITINKLNDILNDLIEVVSMKSKLSRSAEKINLSREINEIKDLLRNDLNQSFAKVVIDIADDFDLSLQSGVIQSILLNFFTNSIKYRKLSVYPEITIKAYMNNFDAVIEFSDNGVGMDLSRIKDRVFGLYQRFHPEIDGKGLGLYIVKTQVTGLGGQIDIESEPQSGTKFIIRFPSKNNLK